MTIRRPLSSLDRRRLRLRPRSHRPIRVFRKLMEDPAHFFSNMQTSPVEPDPYRARLEVENLSDLFGRQLLHVVQYKHEPQLHRDGQHRLMQKLMLRPLQESTLRSYLGILEEPSKFRVVRHQVVE